MEVGVAERALSLLISCFLNFLINFNKYTWTSAVASCKETGCMLEHAMYDTPRALSYTVIH